MKRSITLAGALLVALLGCATVGTDFDSNAAAQLQVGTSSLQDAVKLLGNPSTTTASSGGYTSYTWSYTYANALGSGSSKMVVLVFKDGVLAHKTVSAM